MSPRYQMIHKNFNVPDDPWWRAEYCDRQGVDDILKQVQKWWEIVILEIKKDLNYWNCYKEFQYQKYLFECITGECNVDMEFKDLEEVKEEKINNPRLYKKIQNLNETVREMFPEIYALKSPEQLSLKDFDAEYVKKVHSKVGRNIIPNAGSFRTKSAKPAGEFIFYLEPHLIEAELKQLLQECRKTFSDTNLPLLDAVKYAACFLELFLFIHPFSNGNGRTGRLLLSRLLARYTIIPLSLYTSGFQKDVFLNCIREARSDFQNRKPSTLARFILEAILKEYEICCYVMDVEGR